MEVFRIVIIKTCIMITLLAVGYLFGRTETVSENARRDIAVLVTKFLLPAYLFPTIAKNTSVSALKENASFFVLGIISLTVTLISSFLISKCSNSSKTEKLINYYILAFPNISYFGYPIVQSTFGDEAFSKFIIFSLPSILVLNTYGAYILTAKRNNAGVKTHFGRENIKSLPIELLVCVIIGIAAGLINLPIPGIVNDFFDFTAACMSPLSMILAGLILSALPLSKLFSSWRAYIIAAIKIFVMPLIVGSLAYICGLRSYKLIFPVLINCLPVGMNLVILSRPGQPYYVSSTVTCFISYVFGLGGVPLVVAAITAIA